MLGEAQILTCNLTSGGGKRDASEFNGAVLLRELFASVCSARRAQAVAFRLEELTVVVVLIGVLLYLI